MDLSGVFKALKSANFNFTNIVISLCLIGVVFIGWMIFKHFYKRYAEQQERETGNKPSSLFFNITKGAVIVLVALAVLQINQINVSSLVAGLGIASAIFGLALQDYLKDVIMGTHIVRDSFFREGDAVKYGDSEGRVITFNMRTTFIQDFANGDVFSVSNRNISEIKRVPDSQLQDIDVGLSYEEDQNHVLEILEGAAKEIAELEGVDRTEVRGLSDFADSALVFRVRFYCYPGDKYALRPKANQIILAHIREAGLRIPYPQMDVHFD